MDSGSANGVWKMAHRLYVLDWNINRVPTGTALPSYEGPPFIRGARGADDAAARDGRSLDEVTREHVQRVLARHTGNATAAARQLGISRTTLWRMLKRWGLARAAQGGR